MSSEGRRYGRLTERVCVLVWKVKKETDYDRKDQRQKKKKELWL